MDLIETPEPPRTSAWRDAVRAAGRRIGFGGVRPSEMGANGRTGYGNPWRESSLEKYRNVIRFSLWGCLAVNAAMFAIFSILFTYQFLRHLWSWCLKAWFSKPW